MYGTLNNCIFSQHKMSAIHEIGQERIFERFDKWKRGMGHTTPPPPIFKGFELFTNIVIYGCIKYLRIYLVNIKSLYFN